uniref:winged helix-turn-helix domain-containing protein n=1 Tax=Jutongia sp. TaxID=2944204 RepID=UPI00308066FC
GLELTPNMHTCYLYGEKIDLPPIEYDILVYLCRHLGRVVSAEELFEAVWGEKYLNSNNTVMAHIARIREKLHENARAPKFIKTVWGVGYKMDR